MNEKRIWPRKECKKCNKMFYPYSSNQNYCQDPCSARSKKTIEEVNAAWLARTEEDRRKQYKNSKDNFTHGTMRLI